MTRWALFAIPLFFAIGTNRVPQASKTSVAPQPQSVSSPDQSPQSPPMTPRQVAEMRADILVARKEYEVAAQAYERILATDPKDAALLNKIGMTYQQLGDGGRAERYYKRAWKYDKHSASAMNNLGTVEYGRRHYKNAIKDYQSALAVATERAPIYSNLGFAYCGRKDFYHATLAFEKALTLDPEVFSKRGGGGSTMQERSAPDPATVYYLMAKSFAKLGNAQETAHYLKLARDTGYKKLDAAETDSAFKRVIRSPLVQEVLRTPAPFGIGKATAED